MQVGTWVVRFREPFLFLFAGREVRLPSRRRALLAWGSGDRLVLFFLRLLFLPIASLFASGHVSLLWLTTGYHLRATFRNWPMLDMPMRDSDCPLSTCPPTNSILDVSAILIFSPSSIACAPRRFISSTPCDVASAQVRAFQRSLLCAWQFRQTSADPCPQLLPAAFQPRPATLAVDVSLSVIPECIRRHRAGYVAHGHPVGGSERGRRATRAFSRRTRRERAGSRQSRARRQLEGPTPWPDYNTHARISGDPAKRHGA